MAHLKAFDLHDLSTVVAHPRDHDGDQLIRHLQRLGCRVDHVWPPPERLEVPADFTFCLIDERTRDLSGSLVKNANGALIGIFDPRDELSVEILVNANPLAIIFKPVDTATVLTNILVARNNLGYQKRMLKKVAKLEETLRSVRKVEQAKAVLMRRRNIDESAAYAYLREQAMKNGKAIGAIATIVVESDEVLAGK